MENLKIEERFLCSKEINFLGIENEVPFVFEAKNKGTSAQLNEFLSENSDKVLEKIYKHGAVLIRGFNVFSEAEFEQGVTNIKQIDAMDGYFMAEPGRSLVDGCKYVHYTNKKYKTGGTLKLGGFHTENHYTCDVPAFISFWCRKPSLIGGETGLVHMGNVYEGLNDSIKKKLNTATFFTSKIPISEVANRYNISADKIEAECIEFGLEVSEDETGTKFVCIYKPAVVNHPIKNTLSLVANLSGEIRGLDDALQNEFESSFSGWKWKLHRIAWRRFPFIVLASSAPLKDVLFIGIPYLIKEKFFKKKQIQNTSTENQDSMPERLQVAFTPADVTELAKLMRKNFTSFKWKKGDILLIDNLQMAHTGMPGLGSRIIRALLANPVDLSYLPSSSGCQQPGNDPGYRSLAQRLNH
jgi:hypothetical protein